jgi:hypothetical protein
MAVDPSCGIVVSTKAKSRAVVEQDLAAALKQILGDPDHLRELKSGALIRAASYTHQRRVHEMVERYYRAP